MSPDPIACDVLVVGAGPAGLCAAIGLKQAMPTLQVIVIEKAAVIGGHTLSGAVVDPRAVDTWLAPYRDQLLHPDVATPVGHHALWWLGSRTHAHLPVPADWNQAGCYVIRLGAWVRILAEIATHIGVDVLPGFAGTACLIQTGDTPYMYGIQTGDFGLQADGTPGPGYTPGISIHARYTLLAEGARGSLTQSLLQQGFLSPGLCPQTYGLGVKELWVCEQPHDPMHQGQVIHTIGWPLDRHAYGGGFMYHLAPNLISVGHVVGLDDPHPLRDPFQELQRFKTHPAIRPFLAHARRIGYGARALTEGGWQAIPQLAAPGVLLIGCSAGFMNAARLKGVHTAMGSGFLAAEALCPALAAGHAHTTIRAYPEALNRSWIQAELFRVRNIRPAFRAGRWIGMAHAAWEGFIAKGRAPWTWRWSQPDHAGMQPAHTLPPLVYPVPDGQLTFDKDSSLALSQPQYRSDLPCHLQIRNPQLPAAVNWQIYQAPESHYCPAGVYQYTTAPGTTTPTLQIDASRCIHCKTCDIRDPQQNIQWVPPEGGNGPHYEDG